MNNDTLIFVPSLYWSGAAEINLEIASDKVTKSASMTIDVKKLIDEIEDLTIYNGVDTSFLFSTYQPNSNDFIVEAMTDNDSLNLNIHEGILKINSIGGWFGTANIRLIANCGDLIDSTNFKVTFVPVNLIDEIPDMTIFNGLDTTISLFAYIPNNSEVTFHTHCDNDSLSFDIDNTSLTITVNYDWFGSANVRIIATRGYLQDSTTFNITVTEPIHTGINDISPSLNDQIKVFPNSNKGIFSLRIPMSYNNIRPLQGKQPNKHKKRSLITCMSMIRVVF